MEQTQVMFPSAGYKLAGTLTKPEGDTKAGVILTHGWKSNRSGDRNTKMTERLVRLGIATLAFDFRGHGKSEGDLRHISHLTQAHDIENAFFLLAGTLRKPHLPTALVGASIGASSILSALDQDTTGMYKCAVLIAPRSDFQGVREDLYSWDTPEGRVGNDRMITDGQATDFYQIAQSIRIPVLILHGTDDRSIPITQSQKLVQANPKHFQLTEIVGGDHMLRAQVEMIVDDAVSFLQAHLI